MKETIRGTTLQILDVELDKGESFYTESGGMAWMSPNISMESNMKGGLGSALGRMMSGESLFMTTYTCTEGKGLISFCSEFPGKIIELDLAEGKSMICQRDAFMAAESSATLQSEFTRKLGAGFFGGEGFFLQKLTGPGKAYLEIAGEVTKYDLQEGQMLKVDPGYIGAFEPTVGYDISRVKGVKNMLFGGEGLFLATLKGPGKIWLQSMPFSNLAKKIARYVPKKG
ncbi:TIGR00266 family protein [Candidatus Woesearchaeota archaeon]|nr:TIGR00266 family protein [Candidatus Woesearchaeota archaeon]